MKKIILFLLVMFSLCSCNCNHNWKTDGTLVNRNRSNKIDTLVIMSCKKCNELKIIRSDKSFMVLDSKGNLVYDNRRFNRK